MALPGKLSTMTAGICVSSVGIPAIGTFGLPAWLYTMTPRAPAREAFATLTSKLQAPRATRAILLLSEFTSGVQASIGSAAATLRVSGPTSDSGGVNTASNDA